MRLFISVNMKDTLRSRVVEIMNIMRAKTVRGNFTRPDNLHITLAFLGEIEPERIDDITRTMHQVGRDKRRKLSFELNDIGRFNDTWWIGVKRDQTLWDLQTALSNSLRKAVSTLIRGLSDRTSRYAESPFSPGTLMRRSFVRISIPCSGALCGKPTGLTSCCPNGSTGV